MRSEQDDASASFGWGGSLDACNEIVSIRLDVLALTRDAVPDEKGFEVVGESAFPKFGP
jgi:hypothetical protein